MAVKWLEKRRFDGDRDEKDAEMAHGEKTSQRSISMHS